MLLMKSLLHVNDVHSALNETVVAGVDRPASIEQLRDLLLRVRAEGRSLAISGSRHAMGGQQFLDGQALLDMRGSCSQAFNSRRNTPSSEKPIWPPSARSTAPTWPR